MTATVDVYGAEWATGQRDSHPAVQDYPIDEALGTTWEELFKEARKFLPVGDYDLDLRIRVR
jgi:hypothetical protein